MSLLDTNAGCDTGSMGISFGLLDVPLKRKFRWLFGIPGIASGTAPALPPRKGGRPKLQFKEYEFQHLHESIWYPLKGEWQTVNLTLYDMRCNENVIFDWLTDIYDPSQNEDDVTFNPAISSQFKIPEATLELYDGCGNVLETWTFENVYPSSIDWGELDMDSSDIVMVDLVLRYDRAFFTG